MVPTDKKTRPRGRPPLSQQQITNTRAHITECAIRLFQNEGYEAVSMRRLAKEAGVTTMTLYKYFDHKIDILRALWGEVFDKLFHRLNQTAAQEVNPRKRLYKVARGYVAYWLDNKQDYFMVFMSSGISQTDVHNFVDDPATLKQFQVLGGCLESALGDSVNPDVIRIKSELLICILNGISHNLITVSSYPWSEPDDLVRVAVEGLTHNQ